MKEETPEEKEQRERYERDEYNQLLQEEPDLIQRAEGKVMTEPLLTVDGREALRQRMKLAEITERYVDMANRPVPEKRVWLKKVLGDGEGLFADEVKSVLHISVGDVVDEGESSAE